MNDKRVQNDLLIILVFYTQTNALFLLLFEFQFPEHPASVKYCSYCVDFRFNRTVLRKYVHYLCNLFDLYFAMYSVYESRIAAKLYEIGIKYWNIKRKESHWGPPDWVGENSSGERRWQLIINYNLITVL